MAQITDIYPLETREWLNSLHAVLRHEGAERASYLIDQLNEEACSPGR